MVSLATAPISAVAVDSAVRFRQDQRVRIASMVLAAVLLIAGCASGRGAGGSGGAEAGWTSGNAKIDRLAAKGHASAIRLVRTEQIADNCGSAAPNWYAVSTTSDTGRKLAADMLAFVSDSWTPTAVARPSCMCSAPKRRPINPASRLVR